MRIYRNLATRFAALLLCAAMPFCVAAQSGLSKRNMVSVAPLLDPANPLYGQHVMVFGYFATSGSDTAYLYGRVCLDRESMKRGFSPNCLGVTLPKTLTGMATFANERFVQIVGRLVPEDILSSYPGRLTEVTRIERYLAMGPARERHENGAANVIIANTLAAPAGSACAAPVGPLQRLAIMRHGEKA